MASSTVVRPAITIKSISFGDANSAEMLTYLTGAIVSMVLETSDPVVVTGTPMVSMQLNEDTFPLMFVRQLSTTELLFQANVDLLHYEGLLVCTQETFLDLNSGSIYREANFLPLLAADLRIGALCCQDTCGVSADVVSRFPVVTQVYSPQSGVFSIGESVDIYVEFSTAIKVVGTPGLILELTGDPVAPYVGLNAAGDSLVFRYTIRSIDFTSALDYRDTQSLFIASTGYYDGIYLNSPVGNISADLTLPLRGSIGSIGRSTNIVINKDRPNIVSAGDVPPHAEDGWRRLRVGAVELALVKPCSRCVIPSINPDTADKNSQILTVLRQYRAGAEGKIWFGQNAIVTGRPAAAVLTLGDPVTLLD